MISPQLKHQQSLIRERNTMADLWYYTETMYEGRGASVNPWRQGREITVSFVVNLFMAWHQRFTGTYGERQNITRRVKKCFEFDKDYITPTPDLADDKDMRYFWCWYGDGNEDV